MRARRFGARGAAVAIVATAALSLVGACRRDRPIECQRLRSCCAKAEEIGVDMEVVRLTCSSRDDSDAVICQRGVDAVVALAPKIAYDEACRRSE